jgi:hypothetical protein
MFDTHDCYCFYHIVNLVMYTIIFYVKSPDFREPFIFVLPCGWGSEASSLILTAIWEIIVVGVC